MPTHASTIAHQQASLLNATAHGEPWSPTEVELVLEPAPAVEVAELLGRTLYAVQTARHLLRKGQHVGSDKRSTPASRALQAWPADDPRWG